MLKKLSFAMMLICLCAAPARAWNSVGHMVVAEVAWRQLPAPTRTAIGALLKAHPHYEKLLLDKKDNDVDGARWAFLRGAVWPDLVRPARPGDLYKGPEITRYHRGAWHYIDVPYIEPGFAPSASSQPATREADNVRTAIADNLKRLSDKSAKAEDRAIALAWLEHLVGDLHQPLHAVSWYQKDFPDGDRGGNSEVVNTPGGVLRLHAFWDEALGHNDDADSIRFIADQVLSNPDLPREVARSAAHKDVPSWVQESHNYAVKFAYLNGRLKYAKSSDYFDRKSIKAAEVPTLPMGYVETAESLSKLRVGLAGQRLAQEIKTALAGRP